MIIENDLMPFNPSFPAKAGIHCLVAALLNYGFRLSPE
jgi:hypothetical protein